MSANLNSLAGVLYEGCVKPKIEHTDTKANLVMRTIIMMFAVYCVAMGLVMESLGSILQLVLVVLSAANGTTLGVYFLGLCCPKANKIGGFWASMTSWITVTGLVLYSRISMHRANVTSTKLDTTIEKCHNVEELLERNM